MLIQDIVTVVRGVGFLLVMSASVGVVVLFVKNTYIIFCSPKIANL